mmetsp:Transcript_29300/g.53117  ORF Transcript_29300/g.53117 Transcript_29300/m.53117 type:complete len:214 (+) Transcript_29300:1324-1965(+)
MVERSIFIRNASIGLEPAFSEYTDKNSLLRTSAGIAGNNAEVLPTTYTWVISSCFPTSLNGLAHTPATISSCPGLLLILLLYVWTKLFVAVSYVLCPANPPLPACIFMTNPSRSSARGLLEGTVVVPNADPLPPVVPTMMSMSPVPSAFPPGANNKPLGRTSSPWSGSNSCIQVCRMEIVFPSYDCDPNTLSTSVNSASSSPLSMVIFLTTMR